MAWMHDLAPKNLVVILLEITETAAEVLLSSNPHVCVNDHLEEYSISCIYWCACSQSLSLSLSLVKHRGHLVRIGYILWMGYPVLMEGCIQYLWMWGFYEGLQVKAAYYISHWLLSSTLFQPCPDAGRCWEHTHAYASYIFHIQVDPTKPIPTSPSPSEIEYKSV